MGDIPKPHEVPTTDGAVPVLCFTDEELMPEPRAEEQLRLVAGVPGVAQHVAVLPDVHYKSRNPTPSGSVVVSRDVILPRAIDTGTNCGMRMIATPLEARELRVEHLDRLFGRLLESIPLKEHLEPMLGDEELEQVLVCGMGRLCKVLDLPDDEAERCENRGRMLPDVGPDAIRAAIPPKAISKGKRSLGTVGAGNHFLELQEVDQVLDEPAARRLGVEKGQVCFMLHSDSRRLGKKILKPVRDAAEKAFRRDGDPGELWTLPPDSEIGRQYLGALAAACHAGLANRAMVTEILRRVVREVFADSSLSLRLIYDCGHETIQRERHGGQEVWVHRHGASHAVPAPELSSDPVLEELGQPVPVAGSMGTVSYMALARPGVARTFHSVAHGAGRTIEKARAAESFDADQVVTELRDKGIRIYRYGADDIAGQAPASFKNTDQVVRAMAAYDLIRPVARLRPIAVLKG